jgi:hypothetical protein
VWENVRDAEQLVRLPRRALSHADALDAMGDVRDVRDGRLLPSHDRITRDAPERATSAAPSIATADENPAPLRTQRRTARCPLPDATSLAIPVWGAGVRLSARATAGAPSDVPLAALATTSAALTTTSAALATTSAACADCTAPAAASSAAPSHRSTGCPSARSTASTGAAPWAAPPVGLLSPNYTQLSTHHLTHQPCLHQPAAAMLAAPSSSSAAAAASTASDASPASSSSACASYGPATSRAAALTATPAGSLWARESRLTAAPSVAPSLLPGNAAVPISHPASDASINSAISACPTALADSPSPHQDVRTEPWPSRHPHYRPDSACPPCATATANATPAALCDGAAAAPSDTTPSALVPCSTRAAAALAVATEAATAEETSSPRSGFTLSELALRVASRGDARAPTPRRLRRSSSL